MNIIIFDNSIEVRTMIQRNLLQMKEPLNIVLAENMLAVNEAICKIKFDLAILDMDKLDGLFSQFINTAQNTNPDIVIILLSYYPSQKIFEKFRNKGADYCFDKATEFEKLLNKIDALLYEQSQLKKIAR